MGSGSSIICWELRPRLRPRMSRASPNAVKAENWPRCVSVWSYIARIWYVQVATSQWTHWGFALENFNAVGQWRTFDTEANAPIETAGELPDGATFDGVAGFRAALLQEPWASQYVSNITSKLLTYAVGRGVEYYDKPAVRKIMREAKQSDYRWSSIIRGIVTSAPFQMRMSRNAPEVAAQ